MALDEKFFEGYSVNPGVLEGFIFIATLLLLYMNSLPDELICKVAIYADNTTVYYKCDQASDLWQQLVLAYELDCGL